jgi:hypothetical protein
MFHSSWRLSFNLPSTITKIPRCAISRYVDLPVDPDEQNRAEPIDLGDHALNAAASKAKIGSFSPIVRPRPSQKETAVAP